LVSLVMAVGLGVLKPGYLRKGAFALFIAVAAFSIKNVYAQVYYPKTVVKAVHFIEDNNSIRAPIVVIPKYQAPIIWHYYNNYPEVIGVPDDFNIRRDNFKYAVDGRKDIDSLERRIEGKKYFWVFTEVEGLGYMDREKLFRKWLENECNELKSYDFKSGPFARPGSRAILCEKKNR
jgi:hypothetical protein